jgi:uncharacterized YigZ family protein
MLPITPPYTTLKAAVSMGEIVKNSEFLAFATPVDSVEAAMAWLKDMKTTHTEANHVCWAYKIHQQYRFSDDGEPSGTAGAPMYRALEGSGLDCLAVAVVRYFGGIKLGAGGLVRAYSGAVAKLLQDAATITMLPRVLVTISAPFEYSDTLFRLLADLDSTERHDDYSERGLEITLWLVEGTQSALKQAISDATRGRGLIKW